MPRLVHSTANVRAAPSGSYVIVSPVVTADTRKVTEKHP